MKKILVASLSVFLVFALGCGNSSGSTPSGLHFPVQKPGQSQREALTSGKLILVEGYLRLQSDTDDGPLLIWPHGFSARREGTDVQVINDKGNAVAAVGDRLVVGGGEIAASLVKGFLERSLPRDATGPYWIIGKIISVAKPPSEAEKQEMIDSLSESEHKIEGTGVTVLSQYIEFRGLTSLADGTILVSQLYEDDTALSWWPKDQQITVKGGDWITRVPLGTDGAPDKLRTGPGYRLSIWQQDNPSVKGGFYFDLVGPPGLPEAN